MAEPKYNFEIGQRFGRLVAGDLVRFVQEHELFHETPVSYLQQGRLRECLCDCGQRRLISESILASGRIQSCGCLRQDQRAKAAERKIKNLNLKLAKSTNLASIQIEQTRLRSLKMTSVYSRDEKAIADCAARLRKLFTERASIKNLMKVEKA